MLAKVKNVSVLLLVVICASCKKNNSTVSISSTDSLNIGLIASYPLNGNLKDESGNNYDLENDGAVSAMDRFGNSNGAYYFDGENAKMIIPAMPKAVSLRNFTVSFWMKTDSLNYAISFLSNPLYICDYSTSIRLGQNSRGIFCENSILFKYGFILFPVQPDTH